jgi:hypothetical protein
LIESDSDSDGGAGGRTGLGSSAGRVAGGSLCGLAPTEGDGVDGATPLPGAGAGEFFFRGLQQPEDILKILTTLGAAVSRDDLSLIRELLASGADPNALDESGAPPLTRVASVAALELLL